MQLDQLPKSQSAHIDMVDWTMLSESEGQRLRALGIDEGAIIETAHRGVFFGSDPMAIKVGRMMIALRRVHARAITVSPVNEPAIAPAGVAAA